VVVSDAHLGHASSNDVEAFHAFLRQVPALGSHLIINGDLFEFWFEYASVIPRTAFPTLERLSGLVQRGVRLTIVGGNHDRWGGAFWRDLGAEFHPRATQLDLAGFHCHVSHGDGVAEAGRLDRAWLRLVGHPLTVGAFRLIHPDLGFAIVRRLSARLAGRRRDEATYEALALAQADYARRLLARRRDLAMVILGHTHRARLKRVDGRRWYLNPGAWEAQRRFALITSEGPELRTFD
jgi:UDP-2,3-diacylglucosamine hydrolase